MTRWIHIPLMAVLAWAAVAKTATASEVETFAVDQVAVALNADRPEIVAIDGLVYRGGLSLWSFFGPFGGISGIATLDGERIVAVNDEGYLYEFSAIRDAAGRLIGISDTSYRPLYGPDGVDLTRDKITGDAESLLLLDDGRFAISFERQHKILIYRNAGDRQPESLPIPGELEIGPANSGLESLTRLSDGRLFALAENLATGVELTAGWIGGADGWEALSYRLHDDFLPTDAARLPDGDVIVLERFYNMLDGAAARLRLIPAAEIVPGAVLDPPIVAELSPPLIVDNFEGIAARETGDGGVELLIVSDDNFNPVQRNLLLLFELARP